MIYITEICVRLLQCFENFFSHSTLDTCNKVLQHPLKLNYKIIVILKLEKSRDPQKYLPVPLECHDPQIAKHWFIVLNFEVIHLKLRYHLQKNCV